MANEATSNLRLMHSHEPGKRHLDGVRMRMEQAFERGDITKVPEITKEPAKHFEFWVVVFHDVPDEDMKYHRGFVDGVGYCRNNSYVTVGVDG
jgi:hypothetical protein